MPAFGPTDAYKEASGNLREGAAWSWQQYQDWLNRMQNAGQISDRLRDDLLAYAQDQMSQGMVPPETIREIGQRIMPGAQNAIEQINSRLQQIEQMNANRTPAWQTMAGIYDQNNAQAGDISRTEEMVGGDIGDTFSRGVGRVDDTTNEILANLNRQYSGAQAGVNDAFGGMRRANQGVGSSIVDRLGGAFSRLRNDSDSTFRQLDQRNSGTASRLRGENDAVNNRLQGQSDSTFDDTRGELDSTISGITGQNRDRYGNLLSDLKGTVGNLNAARGNAFSDLNTSADETFGDAIGDAQALDNSDMIAARVARSLASGVAAQKGRLRRRGIGIDDPQYDQAMREMEMERARATDDAKATEQGRNLDRVNDLRLARQTNRQNLRTGELDRQTELAMEEQRRNQNLQTQLQGILDDAGLTRFSNLRDLNLSQLTADEQRALAQAAVNRGLSLNELDNAIQLQQNRLSNDQNLTTAEEDRVGRQMNDTLNRELDLTTGQSDRVTRLAQEEGDIYRNIEGGRMATMLNLDANRSNSTIDNLNRSFDRTRDWREQNNQATLLNRALEQQDFETAAGILQQMNGAELTALDVQNMVADRGANWVANDYARRDAGNANRAQIYAREQGREMDSARIAQGFGDRANDAYTQVAQQEAGKGNWLGRALMAAAPVAASFIPGVGPAVSGILGAAMGQTAGASAPRSTPGAYGGAGSSPYSIPWTTPPFIPYGQNPQAAQTVRNLNYYSGGQIQPDGSFMVQRNEPRRGW